MPIIEKTQTEDEINQGNKTGESKRQTLTDKIKAGDVFKNLDIPTGEPQQEEVEEQPQEEEQQEQSQEEEASSEESQESEDAEADDLSDLAEDMIPKSKIQPRMDKLNSKIKRLEAENEHLKISRATEEKPVDETTAKLQKMSTEELRTLRREVRVAQLANPTDKTKLTEYLDLEDKIEETIRTAPTRFARAQVAAFNKMADKIAEEYSPKQVEEAAPKIIEEAKKIYAKYPKLQSDVEGQAIALEIAAERYQELSKYSLKAGTVKNLKSQVNTLKRKTSLENNSSKSVGGDPDMVAQLRLQAMSGTRRSKEEFIKSDPRFNVESMIPAEYK